MNRKRIVLAVVLLLVLVAVVGGAWGLLDLPPPRLVLRYGFLTAGGPTGGRHADGMGTGFVEIGPGYFLRGSHRHCVPGDAVGEVCSLLGLPWGEQPDHRMEVGPVAWVEVSRPFWIATTEVTNAQYERFDPDHERHMAGDADAAGAISFDDALAYCRWLSEREPGSYRLPTESEWEYACRAGARTEFWFGDDPAGLGEYAWFRDNGDWRAHPGGEKPANPWGLHDVHGNVEEWCDGVDPYRYEWMEWSGRPLSAEERTRVEAEWRTRRKAELEAIDFFDENGEPIDVEKEWATWGEPTLWPSVRGGGWMSPADDCRISPFSPPPGGPSGIRLVWVPD